MLPYFKQAKAKEQGGHNYKGRHHKEQVGVLLPHVHVVGARAGRGRRRRRRACGQLHHTTAAGPHVQRTQAHRNRSGWGEPVVR